MVFLAAGAGLRCTEPVLLPGGLSAVGGRQAGGGGGAAATGGRLGGGGSNGGAGAGTGGVGAGGIVGPFNPGGRGMGMNMGGFQGRQCGERTKVPFTLAKSDLVFSVGRNSSMSMPFGGDGGTRMSVVLQALRALLQQYQSAVNFTFGYQDFPSTAACGGNGPICCVNDEPIYPSPQNLGPIEEAMSKCDGGPPVSNCVSTSEARPIGDALRRAKGIFDQSDLVEHHFVLIVDGPSTCGNQNLCNEVRQEIAEMKSARISPYVVAVGDQAEADGCLRQAGAAGMPNSSFYAARDPGELTRDLGQIVKDAAAIPCLLSLWSFTGNDPGRLEVSIQNRAVPYDPMGVDGWMLLAGNDPKIQLFGAACQKLLSVPRPAFDVTISTCSF
ncbi:MAG: VWA domain-containing protein [Bacteroidota bacterium]